MVRTGMGMPILSPIVLPFEPDVDLDDGEGLEGWDGTVLGFDDRLTAVVGMWPRVVFGLVVVDKLSVEFALIGSDMLFEGCELLVSWGLRAVAVLEPVEASILMGESLVSCGPRVAVVLEPVAAMPRVVVVLGPVATTTVFVPDVTVAVPLRDPEAD